MTVCAVLLCVLSLPGCGTKSREKKQQASPAELTVIFSSDLLGKIRSCGCVVQDMGGLGRWATFAARARESADNVIVVDAGDVFGPDLAFTQKQAELLFDALGVIGPDALTPGETDFVFGLPFLKGLTNRGGFGVVSANIVDPAAGEPLFGPPFKVVTLKGGLRVAITGVLDDAIRFPAYIDASTFKVLPPIETLKKLVPRMKAQADFLIVLSHMGMERSRELAREVPDFNLVVVGHGKPVIKQLEKEGKTIILATGGSGEYMGRIDLSLSSTGVINSGQMRLIPLDDSIPLEKKIVDLFTQYGEPLTDKAMEKKG